MTEYQGPLTPADCDLSGFDYMPVEVARVRNSGLAATESREACWAAFMVWSQSWMEVPAASVKNDERELASAAGYGRDIKGWRKVRDGALRGFVDGGDGRLYHPVVAVKALEAWLVKLARRMSGGAGNAKRWGVAFDPDAIIASAVTAVAMLRRLDPASDALTTQFVLRLPKTPPVIPDGTPTGKPAAIPPGDGRDIPVGSQGKGSEGKEERDHLSQIQSSPPATGDAAGKAARARLAERAAAALGVARLGDLPPAVSGTLMAELDSMLAQGCDWVTDIAPALALRPNGSWPGSPVYWTRAAITNRDRRLASPMPKGAGGVDARAPESDAKAHARMRSWREGKWFEAWGPAPDEAGCLIPAHILDQYREAA